MGIFGSSVGVPCFVPYHTRILLICLEGYPISLGSPSERVICGYRGANADGVFVKQEVPRRCEAILYGGNYFNISPPQADTDAIKALKLAGKTVYMLYMYDANSNLNQIAFPTSKKLDRHMKPMLSYLKEHRIDGVIFGFIRFEADKKVPYYASKVRSLIWRVKEVVPRIKIGLFLTGLDAHQFTNESLFDFSYTNKMVDMYVVDFSSAGDECRLNTTANGGRLPITSPNENVVTLEQISYSTSQSKMDQNKVFGNFFIVATKVDKSVELSETYTAYCKRPNIEIWCGDSIQIFHDQVKYAKKVFRGMMLTFVDRDDMNNACGCGDYPVTNAYIDAWKNRPMKHCKAIS